ncbi:MAG: Tol biopolymer transporter periplasmic protein [Cyanobium sp. M30B3]|nr:MAG: Tol biopolymer transporter periplasmic protein [Cyanobium sp. M30B3]
MLVVALILGGCSNLGPGARRAAPSAGLAAANRNEPAISGDGRLLASLIEQDGRLRMLLQEQGSGRQLPLRHWRGHTPHGSPALSWNGRYLAGLVQQGSRRRVVVDDRLSGRLWRLPLVGGGEPQRLSLAPDGQRLAVEMLRDGQRQVQVFALDGVLEPDLPGGSNLLGGGLAP